MFASERLAFQPDGGMRLVDDGSVACVDHAITRIKFIRGMVMNGRTEVLNAETGKLLGRTDPCVPVNIDPAATMDNLDGILETLTQERA